MSSIHNRQRDRTCCSKHRNIRTTCDLLPAKTYASICFLQCTNWEVDADGWDVFYILGSLSGVDADLPYEIHILGGLHQHTGNLTSYLSCIAALERDPGSTLPTTTPNLWATIGSPSTCTPTIGCRIQNRLVNYVRHEDVAPTQEELHRLRSLVVDLTLEKRQEQRLSNRFRTPKREPDQTYESDADSVSGDEEGRDEEHFHMSNLHTRSNSK